MKKEKNEKIEPSTNNDKNNENTNAEKIKSYRAFNGRMMLWILVILIMVVACIACFVKELTALGFVVVGVGLICTLPIIFSPIKYVFTKRDVTIVYFFGVKEKIEWCEVKRVTLKGSHYIVQYKPPRKYPFFVSGEIIKSRRTRRLLNKLYKKEIV